MSELICIVCPNSCTISVEEGVITGNKCKRGLDFAKAELTAPTRSVTTTVRTVFNQRPTLPVRTNGEIPKEKVFELIKLLKDVVVDKPVKIGDVVLSNVFGCKVDVIATAELDN